MEFQNTFQYLKNDKMSAKARFGKTKCPKKRQNELI